MSFFSYLKSSLLWLAAKLPDDTPAPHKMGAEYGNPELVTGTPNPGAKGIVVYSSQLGAVSEGGLTQISASPSSFAQAVTTSGAYSAGNVVGGIISLVDVNLTSGGRVVLRTIQVNDKNGNADALDIYFFKATPSGGTYTDKSALAWGTGDSANKIGQLAVKSGDWLTDNSQSSVNYSGLTMKMTPSAATLFMLIVCPTGSTPTFTNGNLTIQLEFDQE